METHSTMEEKDSLLGIRMKTRSQAQLKQLETNESKLEAIETRLTQQIERFGSEIHQSLVELKESIRVFTSKNPASWSHGRSSTRTSPLPLRPSSHHLELGGGRRSPISAFSGFSKTAKEDFVEGEETQPSVIDFGLEALETNTSVTGIASSSVKDVQVTSLSYEEESSPEKETKAVAFCQRKAIEKKVSNSLLEPDHTIEELQSGLLANYCSWDELGAVVSSSLSCGKRVGTTELQACISRQANHVWEPGIFVYPEIQTRWLERVDSIGTLKHCVAGFQVGYVGVINASLGVEFLELEYRKLDIAHCSEVHEFANTFGNIGGTRHLAFDPGGMTSLYSLQSGRSDIDLFHARESCGKTAKFVRVIELVDKGESRTNKETKPEVFHQFKNFKNKTCCMRKQLKYKNWKFKYKRGMMLLLEVYLQRYGAGTDASSIWHRWRYKVVVACTEEGNGMQRFMS